MDATTLNLPMVLHTTNGGTKVIQEELEKSKSKITELCEKNLNQESELRRKTTAVDLLEHEKQSLKKELALLSDEKDEAQKKLKEVTSCLNQTAGSSIRDKKELDELQIKFDTERKHTRCLEEQLKHQVFERERHLAEATKAEERLNYFVTQMIRIFDRLVREDQLVPYIWKDGNTMENILMRASEVVDENVKHKGRIQGLIDTVRQRETQLAERSRAVDRLGEQVTRTAANDHKTNILKQELEFVRNNERELTTRLHQVNSELMDAKVHIRELEGQTLQAKHKKGGGEEIHYERLEREYLQFCDALAAMLSGQHYPCSSTQVSIKEHVRRIITECKEHKEFTGKLEVRLTENAAQLESALSKSCDLERQLSSMDRENLRLRNQLNQFETELAGSELIQDENRMRKQKYFRFLCKLAEKLKIHATVAERMEFSELEEAIIVRLSQFETGELTSQADLVASADRVSGLSRKLKRLQDQLSNRDVQLGLWREKASRLEKQLTEQVRIYEELQVGQDTAERAIAKQHRAELETVRLREEVKRLKAELLDLVSIKNENIYLQEEFSKLQKSNTELEELRQRQAEKIAELRNLIVQQTDELSKQRENSEKASEKLADELRSTRKTCDQLRGSEVEVILEAK